MSANDDGGAEASVLHLRCACGWEATGAEAEVIAAAGEHGLRVHNMRATREEILAMARPSRPEGDPRA